MGDFCFCAAKTLNAVICNEPSYRGTGLARSTLDVCRLHEFSFHRRHGGEVFDAERDSEWVNQQASSYSGPPDDA